MKHLRLQLFIAAMVFTIAGFGQTLTYKYVGVGNSSNTLSGNSNFQYDNGILTMGSTLDNYLQFQNGAGTGHMQFDANGQFTWKTPLNGTGKMALTNTGQLKIGSGLVGGYSYGDQYALQVKDAGAVVYRTLANANLNTSGNYSSYNAFNLTGNITTAAYNCAQINYFQASSGSMVGYQSGAQQNILDFYNVNYSDYGPGHIWAVQSNLFQLSYGSATSTKVINSYLRTLITPGSNVGTYYTLYLEAPFGNGSVSQLGNYWGMYQQSPSAKNYFAGNLLIGTTTDAGYKLDVNGAIRVGSVASDPTGANGVVFYNSSTNQFKGYRNGQWKNFLMEGDATSGSSGWGLAGNTTIDPANNFIGTIGNQPVVFRTYNTERLRITEDGKVGIGVININDGNYKLYVESGIRTRKVKVDQSSWADYVFNSNYKLPSLKEVEEYIKQNKHLPDVASEKEIQQNGLDLGDNQAVLLKKIEELTLYIIKQDKKIEKLETQNKELSDIKKELELIKAKLQTED